MVLAWEETLTTGIKEIDDQHKELISNIDGLLSACNEGRAKEEVSKMVDYLGFYATEHFQTEETFMKLHGYPQYLDHKSEHEKFLLDFIVVKEQFEKEGTSCFFALQVNQKIVNWLILHVKDKDKKLAAFLRDKI